MFIYTCNYKWANQDDTVLNMKELIKYKSSQQGYINT